MRKNSPTALRLLALLALLAAPGLALADGPGTLKFDERSFEVLESAGMAMIVVERSQGEDGAVTVDYATSDGSATAGSDYTPVSGTLSWGNGDGGSKTFMVPILDDAAAEGAETINLTLSNPTGGAAIDSERGTSVLVILANDGGTGGDDNPGDDGEDDGDGKAGMFKFDQRDFAALESAGVAVISVERSRGETGAASVDFSTSPGTATAGADYTPVAGTLSWADGDESPKVFQIPIVDDDLAEGRESVRLILSNPTGGASLHERATAVLWILDDENDVGNPAEDRGKPGTFKFDERNFQVVEGRPQMVITVERSQGEAGSVSVDYAATDGSATDGMDYQSVSGTLSWGPGDESDKTFTVPILDDDLAEGNETVDLALSNPTGGAGLHPTRASSILTILDDDGSTAACTPSPTVLCLLSGRFQVEVEWRTPQGDVGPGMVNRVSDRTGLVWFFNPTNIELLVKLIDACGPFGRFWVFFAATTNVDFTLTVTDTATGLVREYANALGQAAPPVQDTVTFDTCP